MEKEETLNSRENTLLSGIVWPEFDLDGDFAPDVPIKEEMINEVMQELYREITSPTSSPQSENTLSPPPASSSSSTYLAAPFVVEEGKSESCGASVSDSASSKMAGVEYVGVVGCFAGGNGWPVEEEEKGWDFGGEDGEGEKSSVMDGWDGAVFEDEWLEKVMGWGPLELEGWS